jgi:predicted MFS family arabinose efflux permease
LVFLSNGLLFSTYFIRIPSLKAQFGLSDTRLGLYLMLPALGALVSMQLSGAVVTRTGSAAVVRRTMLGLPMMLLSIPLAGGPGLLAIALTVFGVVNGLLDVAMNAQAVAAERALRRPVMNTCHAGWSIGALVGSAGGGLAIRAGLTPVEHFAVGACVLVAIGLAIGPFLLPSAADRASTPFGRRAEVWRSGWTRQIMVLAVTGTAILLTESLVGTWSGIYLHEVLGTSLSVAALGYILFTAGQTGTRLVGDRLQIAIGTSKLVRAAAVVGIAGLLLAICSPWPDLAIAGFATVGLGLAVLLPVIFSAAGHSGGDSSARALAKVNTFTYAGALAGPAVIGWSADAIGLRATMAAVLVLLIAALGVGLPRLSPSSHGLSCD